MSYLLLQNVAKDTSEAHLTIDVHPVQLEHTVTLTMQIPVLPVQEEEPHHRNKAQAGHSVVKKLKLLIYTNLHRSHVTDQY